MKLTCPECESDNLDQSTTGKILCHSCKNFLMLVKLGFHSDV